jgi:hypothetical protein
VFDGRGHWVLTGSLENFRVTREHGFGVVGLKEGRRRAAEGMEPGDLVAFYVTRVQGLGAIARITGPMREDRTPLWPGKPGKPDAYPWRLPAEPVIVLEEDAFVSCGTSASGRPSTGGWPSRGRSARYRRRT